MNEQEIMDTQITMASLFRMMCALPLDKLVEQTNTALDIAPFLDPTLFMQKGKDAECMLRIVEAFRTCRDTIKKEFKKGGLLDAKIKEKTIS